MNLFKTRTAEVYGNRALKSGDAKAMAATRPQSQTAAVRDMEMARLSLPAGVPVAAGKGRVYTVVIDAGHGGDDPGAMSGGLREKNITLSVARELKRQLEENGHYKVVLTRDRDIYIKLRERLGISRQVKGDVFISIHADKIARSGIRGASIYTLSETASDDETARLAEDENNAGVVAGVDLKEESQDVADILLDLAMREKMNESNVLAKAVSESLRRKSVRLLPNSHRSAGFAVLKAPDVPAILIETGFISNPDEAKLLSSPAFQQKLASALVDGIGAYFRKMQSLRQAQ
jgi:N-acetylmuramoyl-L-alanine amidase